MVPSKWLPYKKMPQRADNLEASNLFVKLNNTYNIVRKYSKTASTNKKPNGASIKYRILHNKP